MLSPQFPSRLSLNNADLEKKSQFSLRPDTQLNFIPHELDDWMFIFFNIWKHKVKNISAFKFKLSYVL